MPRLFHRPPKYCLHKGTKRAVISLSGQRVYLGPYGSPESHAKYQEILAEWQSSRHQQSSTSGQASSDQVLVDAVTAATLREKRRRNGLPLSIDELILVYRRHAHEYYRKNGKVTRQAEQIDEVLRFLRKDHSKGPVDGFGPVALDELRDQMIDDLDWSRKHINKQVLRLIGMFKWAAEKELTPPAVPMALRSLAGLKKGRTRARETQGVTCVDDTVVEKTIPHLPEIIGDMGCDRPPSRRPNSGCRIGHAESRHRIDPCGSL